MRKALIAVATCAFVTASRADPVPPSSHPEKEFRSIGDGLLVPQNEVPAVDSDGNTTMLVFSRAPIRAEAPYTLDLSELAGIPADGPVHDGGAFGLLQSQSITLDCVHRTYQVIDSRRLIPEPIWRPASTLPALAPVFRFACRSQSNETTGSSQNSVEFRPPANVVPGPSFDCSTAHSLVEHLICTDSELAGLDREFSQLYARARALAPDLEAFRRSSYRAWQQKQICVNKPCLVAWYAERRRQLSQFIAHNSQDRATEPPAVSSQTSQ